MTSGQTNVQPLTMEEVEKMLEVAHAKATEIGAACSLSVVDARGDLLGMVRMDGARWNTIDVSRGKAWAAATFQKKSAEISKEENPALVRSLVVLQGGRIITSQGGVPVFRNGVLIGGAGGSGGRAFEDEGSSQAGVEAIGCSITP